LELLFFDCCIFSPFTTTRGEDDHDQRCGEVFFFIRSKAYLSGKTIV
jgi:hypothetical protein